MGIQGDKEATKAKWVRVQESNTKLRRMIQTYNPITKTLKMTKKSINDSTHKPQDGKV